jgi:hypothetical protein
MFIRFCNYICSLHSKPAEKESEKELQFSDATPARTKFPKSFSPSTPVGLKNKSAACAPLFEQQLLDSPESPKSLRIKAGKFDTSNVSSKTLNFTERVITKNFQEFLHVSRGVQTHAHADQLATAAAANKLNASINLLAQSNERCEERDLINSLQQLGQACVTFGMPAPALDTQFALTQMAAQNKKSKKISPAFVVTQELVDWYKRCAESIHNLSSMCAIDDDVRRPSPLPSNIALDLEAVTKRGIFQLLKALKVHNKKIETLFSTQRKLVISEFERCESLCAGKASSRQVQDAWSNIESIRLTTDKFAKEMDDFISVMDFVQPFIKICNCNPETINEFSYDVGRLIKQMRSSKAGGIFTANCAKLELLRHAGYVIEPSQMARLDWIIKKLKHLRLTTNLSLDPSDDLIMVDMANLYAMQTMFAYAVEQIYNMETDLRCFASQLDSSPTAQYPLRSEIVNILRNTAESCGELRVAQYDLSMLELFREEFVSTEQAQIAQRLIDKYLKFDEAESDASDISAAVSGKPRFASAPTVFTNDATLLSESSAEDLSLEPIAQKPATFSKSHLGKGRTRKVKSKSAAAAKQDAFSSTHETLLSRAHQKIQSAITAAKTDSDGNPGYLKQNAFMYTDHQFDLALNRVTQSDEFPYSVSSTTKPVDQARTCLENTKEKIEQQLFIIQDAIRDICNSDPDSSMQTQRQDQANYLIRYCNQHLVELAVRIDELQNKTEWLSRAQIINCFLANPTYDYYDKLRKDNAVHIAVSQTRHKKQLAPITILGFEKPVPDYLDIYRIDITGNHLAELTNRPNDRRLNGWVELHLHFNSKSADAQPTCGHLKNSEQARVAGPYVFRGRIPNIALIAFREDIVGQMTSSLNAVGSTK